MKPDLKKKLMIGGALAIGVFVVLRMRKSTATTKAAVAAPVSTRASLLTAATKAAITSLKPVLPSGITIQAPQVTVSGLGSLGGRVF